MPDDMPNDPISELAQGAAQMHELFTAYLEAGFNEHQALYLLGQIIHAGNS